MCKKLTSLIFLFLTLTTISGCSSGMNFSDGDMDIYKKIHKKYAYMESYTAKAEMTVYSNKTENTYTLLQYAKEPDMYKTEFLNKNGETDTVIIENNGIMTISSPSGDSLEAKSSEFPECTFINEFFSLFYKSQETSINVSAQESSSVLLETDIFPISKEAKKAVMTLDNNANVKSIKIYDAGRNLRSETVFTEFNYNEHIYDEIFNLR